MAEGGRSQLKMSEETFDFVCTACARDDKTIEAVKYCVECSGYCCQPCTDVHNKFPTLFGHNLLEVSQGNQASGDQSSMLEFPTERCSIHKGKVVDMYCGSHDVVGCYVCIAKDHKCCQNSHVHSIPDMIDTIFKLSDCKQTHSLLKDMVVSMATLSKSKDKQLQILNKARKEAMDKVITFQKAIEAIVRKAVESSKREVEATFKELETEALQQKKNAENICENLGTLDEKLKQAEGNRAQKFVCSKLTQEMIKAADREKIKQQKLHNTHVQISFIPDHSLMENIKSLKGIGEVQKHEKQKERIGQVQKHEKQKEGIGQVQKHEKQKEGIGQVQKHEKQKEGIGQVQKHGDQKHDNYKIKGSGDINIRLSNDSNVCHSYGCCLTHDNKLLVTDYNNKKLKRIDIQKMSVVDYCTLDSRPNGVCCISKDGVAVACEDGNMIQFDSIQNKMIPTRQIRLSHRCHGIAFKDDKFYVTDNDQSLYVYDMAGTRLKTISQDKTGNKLFSKSSHVTFNESGNKMFVGCWYKGVVCFDGNGNFLSTVTDFELSWAYGVCVDGRGNMFVVGCCSDNVVQFNENGEKVGVVVKKEDGLYGPVSVSFHQGLNRLFVTMGSSDVVKMYELE